MTSDVAIGDRVGELATDAVVRLRPVTVTDAAEHAAGLDAEWRRWLGSGHGSVEGAHAWLQRCELQWRSQWRCTGRDGDRGEPVAQFVAQFVFGLRAVGDDALLGTVELQVGEPALPPGQASISCGVYPKARGRGLAAHACHLASSFALRHLAGPPWQVTAVVAQIDPRNVASLRMIERAGFGHVTSCLAGGEPYEIYARSRRTA